MKIQGSANNSSLLPNLSKRRFIAEDAYPQQSKAFLFIHQLVMCLIFHLFFL